MKKYLYLILFFLICVPAIAGTINSYTLKSPPDDADTIVIYDSDDGSTKKIQVGDISGSGTESGWTDGGTNVYLTTTTDGVAIGTTTPNSASLEVVKQSTTTPLKISSSATGNGDYLVVTSGGAVGIGTTGPLDSNNQFYLNLYKSFNGLRAFAVNNPNTGTSVRAGIELATSDSNGYIRQYPTNSSTTAMAGKTEVLNESGNGLALSSNTGGIAFLTDFSNQKMYLSNAGNLGIGSTSPTQKVDVSGTVKATAFSGDGSALTGITSGGWTDGGTNVYTTTTTDNVGIGTTTPMATLNIVKSGTNIPLMVSASAGGVGNFLVVTSEGAVGIGTSSPLATNNQWYSVLYKDSNALREHVVRNPNTGTSAAAGIELVTSDSNTYLRQYPTNFSNATQAGKLMIHSETGNGLGISTDNGDISFYTNFLGKAMTILNASKNVGIGTASPVSKLEVNGLIVPDKVTADPCTAGQEGAVFYNDTSNYWCGCNGTDDVKLTDNTTACF